MLGECIIHIIIIIIIIIPILFAAVLLNSLRYHPLVFKGQ